MSVDTRVVLRALACREVHTSLPVPISKTRMNVVADNVDAGIVDVWCRRRSYC